MSDHGAAEYLLHDDVLNKIFDGMEESAKERGINAKPSDDEQRRTSMAEVRAIRAVRKKLLILSEGPTKPIPRSPRA